MHQVLSDLKHKMMMLVDNIRSF